MIISLYDPKPNTTYGYHKDAGGDEYYGVCARGTLTTDARWQIVKMEYTGNNWVTKYPNGSDEPKFVWDSVESYTYKLLGTS